MEGHFVAKKDDFALFLYIITFVSFSYIIVVAMTSRIVVSKNGESGYPDLLLILEAKAFIFLIIKYDRCKFYLGALSQLRTFPPCASVLRIFIIKRQ